MAGAASGAWSVRADGAALARDARLPWALLLAPAPVYG